MSRRSRRMGGEECSSKEQCVPFFDLVERILHLYVVLGAARQCSWIAFLRPKSRQELPCHWASDFLSESRGSGRTKTSEFEPSRSRPCLEPSRLCLVHRWPSFLRSVFFSLSFSRTHEAYWYTGPWSRPR